MRHSETAKLEIGIERLHVAQDRVAGRRIAVVADRGAAGQRGDYPRLAVIVRNQPQPALLMEALAVEADDARRLLPTVLQGVQPQRGHGRGVRDVPHTEHTALLVRLASFPS